MKSSEAYATVLTISLMMLILVSWWEKASSAIADFPQASSSSTMLSMALLQMPTHETAYSTVPPDYAEPEVVTPYYPNEVKPLPVDDKPSVIPAQETRVKSSSKKIIKQSEPSVSSPTVTTNHSDVSEPLSVEPISSQLEREVIEVKQEKQQDKALMAHYRHALMALLKQHQDYPRMSRKLHEEGIVLVRFVIHASGHVTDVGLVTSSGFERLDEAAQAIFAALNHQLIPFLDGMEAKPLTFELPIRYALLD